MQSQKILFSVVALIGIITIILLTLLSFNKTLAASSPSFGIQQITDERNKWVQTYGNDSTHLKSGYTSIPSVDYLSDGKILNATYWLASNSENASTYNQPDRKISYGMLIDADSNTKTGYNGANYDFYIEAVNGKWSEYLYQYSSTGNYALIGSKANYTQLLGVHRPSNIYIYNIHFITSIVEPIAATLTKPIFNNKVSGFIDPEFFASKKYPSIEYLTSPTNLTVTVIPPLNVNDQFKNFWDTYGQPISIIVGGFAGGFATPEDSSP